MPAQMDEHEPQIAQQPPQSKGHQPVSRREASRSRKPILGALLAMATCLHAWLAWPEMDVLWLSQARLPEECKRLDASAPRKRMWESAALPVRQLHTVRRHAGPAQPAQLTIERRMLDIDARVAQLEKPEEELYWHVLAYCTACRTPWCKLPWRRNTCLKGEAQAEGRYGSRCDMSFEDYEKILVQSVPVITSRKARAIAQACWKAGDRDPSGIGAATVVRVPRPAATEYCDAMKNNGIQCSVAPDSVFRNS
mmetsp:Transcript_68118/g.127201  ORF Transcript_68118/g.127201 Transcript_68118/m.127201 type:complete len:252 (+) Transcript_68118:47-802(+)